MDIQQVHTCSRGRGTHTPSRAGTSSIHRLGSSSSHSSKEVAAEVVLGELEVIHQRISCHELSVLRDV